MILLIPNQKLKQKLRAVITYDTYIIEKIILEPEPNYFIPVNLYRPTKITEPIPAILTPVGHYNEGKFVKPYQTICASLAQRGNIALIFDPIGQGERDMLNATENIDDFYCVLQHSLAGNLAYLLDQSISHFFIQDCIYALDYLIQRDDVDRNRIGCVGHSGGGTATAFLTSIDDRVKAGMSVHFITKYAAIIESALHGGDPDQSLFGLLSTGFDMDDYVLMSLPRAFTINAGIKDYFPIEGSREVYRDTKKYYKMFGIPEKLSMVEVDCGHQLNPEVRKNIYKWANEQFNTTLDLIEQKTEILSAKNLACFDYKSSHTVTGLTPFDIYYKKNIEYASSRKEYTDKYYNCSYDVFVNNVCLKLKSLLSLDLPNTKSEIEAYKKEFL